MAGRDQLADDVSADETGSAQHRDIAFLSGRVAGARYRCACTLAGIGAGGLGDPLAELDETRAEGTVECGLSRREGAIECCDAVAHAVEEGIAAAAELQLRSYILERVADALPL